MLSSCVRLGKYTLMIACFIFHCSVFMLLVGVGSQFVQLPKKCINIFISIKWTTMTLPRTAPWLHGRLMNNRHVNLNLFTFFAMAIFHFLLIQLLPFSPAHLKLILWIPLLCSALNDTQHIIALQGASAGYERLPRNASAKKALLKVQAAFQLYADAVIVFMVI